MNNANKVNLVNRTDPFAACTSANYQDCYAKRTPVRWNDFGGTIGGPVAFGGYNREKNKTFFFFSEEARRIINYATFNPTMPSKEMLQGNFIQPVCITTLSATGISCPAGATPCFPRNSSNRLLTSTTACSPSKRCRPVRTSAAAGKTSHRARRC